MKYPPNSIQNTAASHNHQPVYRTKGFSTSSSASDHCLPCVVIQPITLLVIRSTTSLPSASLLFEGSSLITYYLLCTYTFCIQSFKIECEPKISTKISLIILREQIFAQQNRGGASNHHLHINILSMIC